MVQELAGIRGGQHERMGNIMARVVGPIMGCHFWNSFPPEILDGSNMGTKTAQEVGWRFMGFC